MFSNLAEQVANKVLEEVQNPSDVAVLMLKQIREVISHPFRFIWKLAKGKEGSVANNMKSISKAS